jgi:large subunit ribosomal protein L33
MAKKGNRIQVILECTEHKTCCCRELQDTSLRKTKIQTDLEIKKFNPILKRMTVHKEIK